MAATQPAKKKKKQILRELLTFTAIKQEKCPRLTVTGMWAGPEPANQPRLTTRAIDFNSLKLRRMNKKKANSKLTRVSFLAAETESRGRPPNARCPITRQQLA